MRLQKRIKMFLRSALLLFSCVLLVSCGKKNDTIVRNIVNASPVKVFDYKETKIPYYDFDEFEKFLNIKDDETYIINFWATWCTPCVEELPHFESINTTYKHKGINVVLVSLDKLDKIESNLLPFMEKYDIRSEVIVLNDSKANKWIDRVDPHWSGAIPITIIYNKEKRLFYEKTFTLNELKNEVEKFL